MNGSARSDAEAPNDDDGGIGRGDFLGSTADNRINIADPDRWEGLGGSDDEEGAASSNRTARPQHPQHPQQPQTTRESGDAENEGYRMFLTHRQSEPPPQQPPPPPPPPPQGGEQSDRGRPGAVNNNGDEDRYVENLGSRLVRSDRWEEPAAGDRDNDEDATPRAEVEAEPPLPPPPPPTDKTGAAVEGGHFSVRKGGNQLADLHPSARRQMPPPPPVATQSAPLAAVEAADIERQMPAVPKEVYVGYLRLDSGQTVGPFRWNVDTIETPASLEEGLSSQRPGDTRGGLFSLLIDSQAHGDTNRQRVITRNGRLAILDPSAGNSEIVGRDPAGQQSQQAAVQRSLQALSSGLASLSNRSSGNFGQQQQSQAEDRLTRLLADSLAGNGVSLMIACVNPAENAQQSGSSRSSGVGRKAFADAAVKAAASAVSSDSGVAAAAAAAQAQLEQLVRSLRQEVASLKAENSALKDSAMTASPAAAEAQAAAPPAAALPASPEKQRPQSKSSYQSLYEMLQEYMQENESLRNENLDLAKYQGEHRKTHDQLARENKRLATRLDRLQRQAANQKPLYVVSNPESRSSTKQQQQQQQLQISGSASSVGDQQLLPPIPTAEPRRAFPTPPSIGIDSSAPSSQSESPHQMRQRQQQQMQQQQMQQQQMQQQQMQQQQMQQQQMQQQQMQQQQMQLQQMQQFASPEAQAAAAYYYHVPVGPSYGPMQQPPMPHPVQHPQQQQPHQRRQQHRQSPPAESPLYVPKPGEKTYRGRFQQAAAVSRDPHRHPEINTHAVQDVNKLNDSLKGELRQLDGAIQQHQRVNALQSDIRRNEGKKVLKTF